MPVSEVLSTSTPKRVELRAELISVCACESTGRPDGIPTHYDSEGHVLIGRVNPLDTGICQINRYYHEAQAQKMGLDLFDEQDNIRFANWLFETQGYEPWKWSASCHGHQSGTGNGLSTTSAFLVTTDYRTDKIGLASSPPSY